MKKKPEKSGSKNPVKREAAALVRDRIRRYKAQRARIKAALVADPGGPKREKEADRAVVALAGYGKSR